MDFIWMLVGFLFTLLIFSYLFGDNPLFRIATYIFIGVTAGYAGVMVYYYILWPRLIEPLLMGEPAEKALVLIPLILSGLMIFKMFPRLTRLGNISVGYLVGVGAAVMLGGSVLGTLFPQLISTINLFDIRGQQAYGFDVIWMILEGGFILFGTVSTLAYFHFSTSGRSLDVSQRWIGIEILSKIGQVFIAVTLGALFAGVYITALTALIERLDFIKTVIFSLIF